MTPMGSGCYHICPNSDHYYSPEQERADDATHGDLDRFEGWGDPEVYEPEPDEQPDPRYGMEHTRDEFGEDRWFVVDTWTGDWVGEDDPYPTRELAAAEAIRMELQR
jgi:hypothetical protein